MKLFGTYPSHFTRKVRVVLQELALPFDFIVLDRLSETGIEKFAGNPLHQIPVLIDDDRQLFESDLICEYLLQRYGSQASHPVFLPTGDEFEHRKRLAIMNGGMASGVKLIRAKRSGIHWDYPFFQQEKASLTASLDWLECDLGERNFYGSEERLSLLEITLVSFADWAIFREMIPSLSPFPNISRLASFHNSRQSFASTHPFAGAK